MLATTSCRTAAPAARARASTSTTCSAARAVAPPRASFSARQARRCCGAALKAQTDDDLDLELDLDLDAMLDDLDIPDLDNDLRSYQELCSAHFDDAGVATTFDNDAKALIAINEGVALVDRSHEGRLRVGGPDRLTFLSGQSTADFEAMAPGSVGKTVFVTATARTIDVATAVVQGNGVLLLLSADTKDTVLERLNKHIFPADQVAVSDISEATKMFHLVGPEAQSLLADLGVQDSETSSVLNYGGSPVMVIPSSIYALPGTTLIADETIAADLWKQLASNGAEPVGSQLWEKIRILQGVPAPGSELTDDYNPLEAGLYEAIGANKGCYVGQETIAKVHNNNAVKQQLWGLEVTLPCAPGAAITDLDGKKIGTITSVTEKSEGVYFALGYVKCRRNGEQVDLEGEAVEVDIGQSYGASAKIVAIANATRSFGQDGIKLGGGGAAAAAEEAEDVDEAKQAKLKAMEERMAAYLAQQKQSQQ